MNSGYSKIMKKLMIRKPGNIVHAAFFLILIILIICLVYGFQQDAKQIKQIKGNAQEFNPLSDDSKYNKLVPLYLFDFFATNEIETINYYIAMDQNQYTYIVAVNANDADQYQDLIDYTNENSTTPPAEITFWGIPAKIDDSLKGLAIDNYNTLAGDNSINESNFKDTLGIYYLDTTQDIPTDDTFLSWILILMILIIPAYIILLVLTRKSRRCRKATLNEYNDMILWKVDEELQDPATINYKKQKVYFTKNYIISNARGFSIIPYEEMVHVYAIQYVYINKSIKFVIVAETKDHSVHEIAVFKHQWIQASDEIVHKIQSIVPDIEYGFHNGFVTTAKPKYNIAVDTMADNDNKESNVLLGMIGAILGSAIGAVLWITIGQIGFIAGIAGYIIMIMAIAGYRKFSGFLDKKGQILALIIAFLMIYCANYVSYALAYYFATNISLLNALVHTPEYLTNSNAWGNFTRDIAVGYLLSIWAGFRVIRSVFFNFKMDK